MKKFSVHFIDNKDGHMNHKIIEAPFIDCVCRHMYSLGHEITSIEEIPNTTSVTLTQETLEELKTCVNNIEGERYKSCNDYNLDLVTESEHRILDIVRKLVSQ